MKCEICGEEILVIVEEERATLPDGRVDQGELGYIPRRSSPLLRCGCYDDCGHEDCPYHIASSLVVRDDELTKQSICPHGEPEVCPVLDNLFNFGTPFPCMMRGIEANDNRQPPRT